MERFTKFIVIFVLSAQPAVAQTLIPATTEDINDFDRQVSEQLKRSKKDKAAKSAFGSQVSEEAKKLNEAGGDAKKEFGKWVSGERKKADQGRPSAAGTQRGNSGGGAGNSGTVPKGPPAGKGPKKN